MNLPHGPFHWPPPEKGQQQGGTQEKYEAMVRYLDTLVGRIAERVDELGLSERRLIMFTGDNGSPSPMSGTRPTQCPDTLTFGESRFAARSAW